jgi:hypothetical protein
MVPIATKTVFELLLGVPQTPGVGLVVGVVVGNVVGVGIGPLPPPRLSFVHAASAATAARVIQPAES